MRPMGQEALCTVRIGRKTLKGTALLETEELIFRGDLGFKIPFAAMKTIEARGEVLFVTTEEAEYEFDIGLQSERWMRLVKEPKGLFEKLNVEPAAKVAVVDVADALFLAGLKERIASVWVGGVPEGADVIFFGAHTKDSLRRLPLLRARLDDEGAIWIIRPKGVKTITENDVRDAARDIALVDTKVVAFSRTHTAEKYVIPVEMRGKPMRTAPVFLSIPPSAPSLPTKEKSAPARAAPSKKKAGGSPGDPARDLSPARPSEARDPAQDLSPARPSGARVPARNLMPKKAAKRPAPKKALKKAKPSRRR
jgi:hypothetical protein